MVSSNAEVPDNITRKAKLVHITKPREEMGMRYIAKIASVIFGLACAATAQAQDVVKIGQIEAQTGTNAIYGWMGSQGVPMAIDEINKAGGFKVGDKAYKLELISLDQRGD